MKRIILFAAIILFPLLSNAEMIGIGQSNANRLIQRGGYQPYFINCAHDGMPISTFAPNLDSNSFFGDCVAKILKVKQVTGIVLWQGESDAFDYIWRPYSKYPDTSIGHAQSWGLSATKLLFALRDVIGYKVPIVVVNLHAHPTATTGYNEWLTIRGIQQRMVGVFRIDSNLYESDVDNMHFTDDAYKLMMENIVFILNNNPAQRAPESFPLGILQLK